MKRCQVDYYQNLAYFIHRGFNQNGSEKSDNQWLCRLL